MKTADIKLHGVYTARVSGRFVRVRIEAIVEREGTKYRRGGTEFAVRNLTTNRELRFRSAAKFRTEVKEPADAPGP